MAGIEIAGRPDGMRINGSTERSARYSEPVNIGGADVFVTAGAAKYLADAKRDGQKFTLESKPSALMSAVLAVGLGYQASTDLRGYGAERKPDGWGAKAVEKAMHKLGMDAVPR